MMENGLSAADVAAVTNGGYGGMGGFGGEGWWVIVLLLALGGRGFGFGGNGVGENYALATDFATIERKMDGINNGICDATFALNNTINTGFANIALENQKCCCETQRLIERGFCDTNNAIHNSARDIIDNANCNSRAILDFLVKDKIETLTAENQALKLHASQAEQNTYLLNQLRPAPIPAYTVANPYAYYGCGCGCGCYNG